IDRVHAVAATGRRRHRDLTALEPLNLAWLVRPGAQKILRFATRRVDDEEPLILEATELTDERELLAVRRPRDLRLIARVLDLAGRAGGAVRFAGGHGKNEDLRVVARQLVALPVGRQLGD